MSSTMKAAAVALVAILLAGFGGAVGFGVSPASAASPLASAEGSASDEICDKYSMGNAIKWAGCKASTKTAETLGVLPNEDGETSGPVAGVVGATGTLTQVARSVDNVAEALSNLKSLTPEGMAEEWAKAAAEGVVWVMDKIQEGTAEVASPSYDQRWWVQQYSVMVGLALILFVGLLIVVCAKIGGSDGAVSGVVLLRDAGIRIWTVPVLLFAGPALMMTLQGGFADISKSFAQLGNRKAGSALEEMIKSMGSIGDSGWGALGGGLLAMIALMLVAFLGLVVMIELAFAAWAANVIALLFPLAVIAWVYPPWRRVLGRMIGLLIGLWMMPAAINFVYWSTWSAAAEGLVKPGEIFDVTLYVIVGTFMLAAAPFLPAFIIPKIMPAGDAPVGMGHPAAGGQARSRHTETETQKTHRLSQERSHTAPEPQSAAAGTSPQQGSDPGSVSPAAATPDRSVTPARPAAGASGGAAPAGAPAQVGTATAAQGGQAASTAGGASAGGAVAKGGATAGSGAAAGAAGPLAAAALAAKVAKDKAAKEMRSTRDRHLRSGS